MVEIRRDALSEAFRARPMMPSRGVCDDEAAGGIATVREHDQQSPKCSRVALVGKVVSDGCCGIDLFRAYEGAWPASSTVPYLHGTVEVLQNSRRREHAPS